MSKRQFKSQASSGRAGSAFGGFGPAGFGSTQSSILSFVQEPPDYLHISDPNVVVTLKNLTKKDSTTKAKALEDLQTYLGSSSVEIEDPFLEAWVKLFPRLSIDNARRVRQLAQTLNGHVCTKCGKRTVKYMPRIAGPWLSGTFDNDRAAARAAVDALNLVFPAPEKVYGVRKSFQRSILEYCRDALLHETVSTLSDERNVSSDDAEATYARVISSSLSLLGSLITDLRPEDQAKEQHVYEEIFADNKLWEFARHSDASVRRSMHRLVQVALERQRGLIYGNLAVASTSYIYKGLQSDQSGSALGFIQTLEKLTTDFPSLWTDAYTAKKPAITRLRHFLKQGSQSSSLEFWEALSKLLKKLPDGVLPTTGDAVKDLLSAARGGVSKKEERFHASAAWPTYFTLVDIISSHMEGTDAENLVDGQLMPVIRQYLYPAAETSDWSITGAKAPWIVSKAATVKSLTPLLDREWPLLADKLIEAAKMSQPEQSKEFDSSQKHVAGVGERWAALQREFWNEDLSLLESVHQTFVTANNKLLAECISLLKSRNGKPYGAAAVIEELLRNCAKNLLQDHESETLYFAFATNDVPDMVFSPSARHLIHGLYAANSDAAFSGAFVHIMQGVLNADNAVEDKLETLRVIFTHNMPSKATEAARNSQEFQAFVSHSMSGASAESFMDLFGILIEVRAVSPETTECILSHLTSSLSAADDAAAILSALELLSQKDESAVRAFMAEPSGTGEQLLPAVLRLEQSDDDSVAEKATTLSSRLSSAIGQASPDTKYSVVLRNLESVSGSSLDMDAVYDLVKRLLGPERTIHDPSDLLPSFKVWTNTLCAAIRPPRPSLALMSTLGGAVHLVKDAGTTHQAVQYDVEGFSQALRISMYVCRILAETDLLQNLGDEKELTLALLHLSVLVAGDNVSIAGANHFWRVESGNEGEAAVLDFIAEANGVLGDYWKTLTTTSHEGAATTSVRYFSALNKLRGDEDALSPLSYYITLSSAQVHANHFELQGFSTEQAKDSETMLRERRSAKQFFPLISCIAGFHQPLSGTQTMSRFCNELVADLTDFNIAENENAGLEKLVSLNTILRTDEEAVSRIAKQRLIFLVKHMLPWLDLTLELPVKAEVCKALTELLPGMDDMYGDHWEQALSFVVGYWSAGLSAVDSEAMYEAHILVMNASLKLFGTLEKLSKSEEANDDLIDTLKDKRDQIQYGLIHLLIYANGISDEMHQPLMITHELLARQIASLPVKVLKDIGDLYPLIYTPSRPVQLAAFDILHKQIPAAQEQISFDAALDNKTALLPEELLSLILEAPTLDSLAEASFHRMMPLSLQGYLYAWRLIFDHFDGSSYRVKGDYIEQLKEGGYLSGLLWFTFDFLGHSRGRPVDASKFDITDYIADTEPSPEKDVQWLLTHLYYLALLHLPSLVKSYYLDIRSRQTSIAVESWTAKHISPLIISASLSAVDEWSEKSVKDDPEFENMTVKVGMRSKEMNVSYVVDEQTMAIKVVLPDAYPLASAQVVGVSRVAVKEEKWQSWIRNCQGVITFSNGSITDGLTAWRKNVSGALKGQTECAICYSIISADKQLPTKRCTTCKNLFHSSCLFKWFKTSNASTCPLCRNPFNFN